MLTKMPDCVEFKVLIYPLIVELIIVICEYISVYTQIVALKFVAFIEAFDSQFETPNVEFYSK